MDNLQPSSYKHYEGEIINNFKLLERLDTKYEKWKVQCIKCNSIYELGIQELNKSKRCTNCPSKEFKKYKINEIYGIYKIISYKGDKTIEIECMKCNTRMIVNRDSFKQFLKRNNENFCKFCKPITHKSRKYPNGTIIGSYKIIKYIENGLYLVECIHCGKQQEQGIQNIKKMSKEHCWYCLHPYSNKPSCNRTRNNFKSISREERAYNNYKKTILSHNNNTHKKYKSFQLSLLEYTELINGNCFYCGKSPSENNMWNSKRNIRTQDKNLPPFKCNGIDRINPNEGYIKDNCVSCCPTCNKIKMDLSLEDFYSHIEKIYKKRFNDQSKDVASSESEMESPLSKGEEMV